MSFLCRIARTSAPTLARAISMGAPAMKKKEVNVTFLRHDGTRIETKGKIGDSFLNVVVDNDIKLEGYGACEGTLTCSTCHLILKQSDFDSLPNEPEGEEIDMLELAKGVTDTSRLGCQVYLTEEMDGIVVKVPEVIDIRLESGNKQSESQ